MRMPYELALESRVSGTPAKYEFATADGVCSKQSFRTAELLLAETLWESDLGHFLQLEANYGVVGTVLAERADSVHMVESSARRSRLCGHNASRNNVDARVSLLADITSITDPVDTVAYAPKPYTPLVIGKQRIADSLSRLSPGGRLYLVASKQTGLARYKSCLEDLATQVERVDSSKGYHVLSAARAEDFTAPMFVEPQVLTPTVDDTTLSLTTVPGLFASSQLDTGTRLLLEATSIYDGSRVLDLCCGYGAIGAYAGRVADCEVWLSDDNKLATRCAECSLHTSGVDATIKTADCTDDVATETFDHVLCNPPTHAGEDILNELFVGISNVLSSDGRASIVHHKTLDLSAQLDVFNKTRIVQRGSEHVVIEARM